MIEICTYICYNKTIKIQKEDNKMEQKRRYSFIIPAELEKMKIKGDYLPEMISIIKELRNTLKEMGSLYDVHFEKMIHLINAEKEVKISINTDGELLIISVNSFCSK